MATVAQGATEANGVHFVSATGSRPTLYGAVPAADGSMKYIPSARDYTAVEAPQAAAIAIDSLPPGGGFPSQAPASPNMGNGMCMRGGCNNVALYVCSACGMDGYCSAECQHADWPKHKLACKQIAAASRTGAAPESSTNLQTLSTVYGSATNVTASPMQPFTAFSASSSAAAPGTGTTGPAVAASMAPASSLPTHGGGFSAKTAGPISASLGSTVQQSARIVSTAAESSPVAVGRGPRVTTSTVAAPIPTAVFGGSVNTRNLGGSMNFDAGTSAAISSTAAVPVATGTLFAAGQLGGSLQFASSASTRNLASQLGGSLQFTTASRAPLSTGMLLNAPGITRGAISGSANPTITPSPAASEKVLPRSVITALRGSGPARGGSTLSATTGQLGASPQFKSAAATTSATGVLSAAAASASSATTLQGSITPSVKAAPMAAAAMLRFNAAAPMRTGAAVQIRATTPPPAPRTLPINLGGSLTIPASASSIPATTTALPVANRGIVRPIQPIAKASPSAPVSGLGGSLDFPVARTASASSAGRPVPAPRVLVSGQVPAAGAGGGFKAAQQVESAQMSNLAAASQAILVPPSARRALPPAPTRPAPAQAPPAPVPVMAGRLGGSMTAPMAAPAPAQAQPAPNVAAPPAYSMQVPMPQALPAPPRQFVPPPGGSLQMSALPPAPMNPIAQGFTSAPLPPAPMMQQAPAPVQMVPMPMMQQAPMPAPLGGSMTFEQVSQMQMPMQMVLPGGSMSMPAVVAQQVPIECCSAEGCTQPGLFLCSRCNAAAYCSQDCQTRDWKRHKPVCKKADPSSQPVGAAQMMCLPAAPAPMMVAPMAPLGGSMQLQVMGAPVAPMGGSLQMPVPPPNPFLAPAGMPLMPAPSMPMMSPDVSMFIPMPMNPFAPPQQALGGSFVPPPQAAAVPQARCAKPDCANAGIFMCSRCGKRPYCSPECQKADWPAHKPFCSAA